MNDQSWNGETNVIVNRRTAVFMTRPKHGLVARDRADPPYLTTLLKFGGILSICTRSVKGNLVKDKGERIKESRRDKGKRMKDKSQTTVFVTRGRAR